MSKSVRHIVAICVLSTVLWVPHINSAYSQSVTPGTDGSLCITLEQDGGWFGNSCQSQIHILYRYKSYDGRCGRGNPMSKRFPGVLSAPGYDFGGYSCMAQTDTPGTGVHTQFPEKKYFSSTMTTAADGVGMEWFGCASETTAQVREDWGVLDGWWPVRNVENGKWYCKKLEFFENNHELVRIRLAR